MNDSRLCTYLVVLVSTGWLINLVAPIFIESYDSGLAANGPLLLVLGSLFATRKRGDRDAD